MNENNTAIQTELKKDHCTCKADCKLHGNCVECVTMHVKDGDHLPSCFHEMLNKRIKYLSGLSEHTIVDELKKEGKA